MRQSLTIFIMKPTKIMWLGVMKSSYSLTTTTTSVINILEAIKIINPRIKYFQPASSNMFGAPSDETQNELTSHNPVSPYGIAKSATFYLCNFCRKSIT